jgi:acyl-coenzyme A synthetase/AMP-(fatty) acid ligase
MQFGTSECLAHWARYRPNAPAVFHNGHMCSFRELDRRVSVLATRLATEAARSNRTAIATRAKLDTFVAMLAAVRAGRSAVLINTGLPPATIQTNLRDASPDIIVGDTSTASIAALVGCTSWVLISEVPESTTSGAGGFPEAQGEQEWGVFFSSGTTGTPKAIERSHHSVITELIGWCLELSLNRQSVFYIGRPVFYTGGAVLSLATLLNGGATILNDVSDETDFEAIWKDYQRVLASVPVTIAFFIPDQLRTFMRLAAGGVHSPLAADCILVMGGPVSGAEKVDANRLLGSRIVESWGNSESLGTITEPEDLNSRPGSIGRPFLGDYMCIVDDDGRTLGPGELGHIAGGLEAGFKAYSNRPHETQQARRFDLIVVSAGIKHPQYCRFCR